MSASSEESSASVLRARALYSNNPDFVTQHSVDSRVTGGDTVNEMAHSEPNRSSEPETPSSRDRETRGRHGKRRSHLKSRSPSRTPS